MKVLQVIAGLDRGGAETLLVNVLKHIDRKEFKFDFLVFGTEKYDYEELIENLGSRIFRIERPTEIGMFKYIQKMKEFLKKKKYDVVHVHNLFNCGPVVFAAFLANVKVRISHSHNTKILDENVTIKKRIYFFLAKILINLFSNHKLTCGKEAGKFLFYNNKNVVEIKNGIDTKKYLYDSKARNRIRAEYNIPDDTIIIGHIGRFNFQKNHMFLLEIFSEFVKKNPTTKLMLLGDGELKEDIKEKINKLNLKEKVILVGNIENANEYYSAFDVFLFPSLFEGLPYTLIEAQANGLPIFASDTISEECNISKTIEFISIESTAIHWVEVLMNTYKNNRYSNEEKIIESGYDIRNTVNLLEKIYKCK